MLMLTVLQSVISVFYPLAHVRIHIYMPIKIFSRVLWKFKKILKIQTLNHCVRHLCIVWQSHNINMVGEDDADCSVDFRESEAGKNVPHEDVSSDAKDMLDIGSAMEVLTRVDLDLAYSSEKLVNLDTLMMHVWAWENEFQALATDDISVDCIEKAVAFDLLSGILDSEWRLNCTIQKSL
ncbi:hypothetical protein POM88_027765 [Heracleum sosnowskyi]|uniref:WIT1/2 N-terminal helical bundle domain-containing protein n=1 Tax=Heracleum sosnowskyi TaxID=360622 RepID=A0AAD8I8K2_9APIA|nr:hypothetical protein POM88_027765 [Heracleum sosnowskyi]